MFSVRKEIAMDIKKLTEAEIPHLIELRRHFHEYPEPSQKEFKTMEFIEARLKEMGIPSVRIPKGGIFGFIDSGTPGFSVLMRADMDALPIQEDPENLSKKKICVSKNAGYSHACGHDGHMSMLLTCAKILSEHKKEWEGRVILMFEEAEEFGERGAGPMLQYLDDEKIHVDACYATHVRWDIPVGKMSILKGGVMAGAFFFRANILGKGGHGSRPDLSVSPIDCFLSFAGQMQSFRMRCASPEHCLTYSFGCVQAGHEPNVIPSSLMFAGTCRFFSDEDGQRFRRQFYTSLKNECENFGCSSEMVEAQYFPVVENNDACVELAEKSITETLGDKVLLQAEPWMASETFALATARYPGILAFTGIMDPEVGSGANHHTAKFDIGEKGLVTGVESALCYTLAMLREKPKISFHARPLKELLS